MFGPDATLRLRRRMTWAVGGACTDIAERSAPPMAGLSAIDMASARMRISSADFGSTSSSADILGQRLQLMLGAADGAACAPSWRGR